MTDDQRARLEGIRGSLHALHSEYDAAIEAHQRALVLWQALPDRPFDAAATHNNLGYAFHEQGQLAKAAEHYDAALALFEGANGPYHPALIPVLYNQTMIAQERGRWTDALEFIDRALALVTTSVGEQHSQTVSVLAQRATVLLDMQRWDEGRLDAERGLAIVDGGVHVEPWLAAELRQSLAKAQAHAGSPQ